MKQKIILLTLLWLPVLIFSADLQFLFNHQMQNATGRSVKQMPDGTFFFIGYADDSLGNTNCVLTKLDKNGNTIWWKSYGDSTVNLTHYINTTASGNLIVAGERLNAGNTDFEIFLFDTLGNVIWERHYGTSKNESLHYILATPDNGFIACGNVTQSNLAANDFLVVKFDSLGFISWQQEYGDSRRNDGAMMLRMTADGKFIISGDTNIGSDVDILLVMIDSTGHEIWTRQVGDSNANGNQSLLINQEGNIILCGESTTPGNFYFDIHLAAYDMSGNFLWSKYIGGAGSEAGFSIVENSKHEYFITGYSTSIYTGAPYTAYLLKLDSAFHPVGLKYFPQPELTICNELLLLNDSSFALAGTSGSDFYFVLAADSGLSNNFTEHDFVSGIKQNSVAERIAKVFETGNHLLQVQLNAEETTQQNYLRIFDACGRLLLNRSFYSSALVDISLFENRFFIWQIRAADGQSISGKFVRH